MQPVTRTRPLIGLTGRTKRGAEIAGIVPALDAAEADVYIRDYTRAIHEAGGLPVHLPGFLDSAAYAGRLDGIVLSGGTDLDPVHYGAEAHPEAYQPEPERDRFELGLVDLAVDEGVPILGICRGAQLLNVWAGGTLCQHVPEHARYDTAAEVAVDVALVERGTTAARPVRRSRADQLAAPPDDRSRRPGLAGLGPQRRR